MKLSTVGQVFNTVGQVCTTVGQVCNLPNPLPTPSLGRLQVRPTWLKGFVRPTVGQVCTTVGQVCNLPNPSATPSLGRLQVRPTWLKVVAIFVAGLLAAAPAVAEDQPDLTAWKDTFDSEETLDLHWNYYGYLPAGGTVSDREHRPQYWEVVDGHLRGNDLPEVHGSGISRKATGTDVRLAIRFKLPPNGITSVALRGDNPILEREWYVMGLHIRPTAIHAIDETTAHPKDSPEAAALKAKGGFNRRFIPDAKGGKMEIAEDVWHELVMEARGREQRVWLDGREVLTYTTLAGDVPKTSVSIGMHSDEPRLVHGYFDDIVFGPLE